jgi:hypothetical protein
LAQNTEKTGCEFFMYSSDYPVDGCYCCDEYDPVPDDPATDSGRAYDIYQACVDPVTATSGSAATAEAALAAAADGGKY